MKVIGRETFLAPVAWEDDWSVVNGGQNITLQCSGPRMYQLEHPVKWRDDFTEPKMSLGWYRKSTFPELAYFIAPFEQGQRS